MGRNSNMRVRKILFHFFVVLFLAQFSNGYALVITPLEQGYFLPPAGKKENHFVHPSFPLFELQQQPLPLGNLPSPEGNFIQQKLVSLIFPSKRSFTYEEIDFLNREVYRWLNKRYTFDQLNLKFIIREEITPVIKEILFNYIPDQAALQRLGLTPEDFIVSLEQREFFYEMIEQMASKIEIRSPHSEKGEGIIPLGIPLDEISKHQYARIVNYFQRNNEHIIEYDLSRGDFNAIWGIIEPQDMNKYEKISFILKHSPQNPITDKLRIEFDKEGTDQIRPVSLLLKDYAIIRPINAEWDEVTIDVNKIIKTVRTSLDWRNIDVFSIVLEKAQLVQAKLPLYGELIIKDVYFHPKEKNVTELSLYKNKLKLIKENKDFLEKASIPHLLPARPLVLSIPEDRKILFDFTEMVERNMNDKIKKGMKPEEAAEKARQEEWTVFSARLLSPDSSNQKKESLFPFLSEYLNEKFDLRRQDHAGLWRFYNEQLDKGKTVAELKRYLAIGITVKPYVERMVGVNFNPGNLNYILHPFATNNRSYRFLKENLTLLDFLKEVLKKISVNYFFRPIENGGTRDHTTGLSYDSNTGKNLSIAATGFQLTYLIMGIEHGWLAQGDKDVNMQYGYPMAKKTLETVVGVLRELTEYEGFLTQYLNGDIERVAQERKVEIYTGSPYGKVLSETELKKLHNKIKIEEELRAMKESEILRAFLEKKQQFSGQASQLYSSDKSAFLKKYSPIYRYGRHGMLFRYFIKDEIGIKHDGDPGNDAGTIDNAIFDWGILGIREYFKDYTGAGDSRGYLSKLAEEIMGYRKWSYFLNPHGNMPNVFNMGWQISDPGQNNRGFYPYSWDVYTDEQLLINILALSSKSYPVPPDTYYAFKREKAQQGFIKSGTNSAFTFHLADVWFDKRNLTDKQGDNWYKNTILATLANKEFTLRHADRFATLDANHFIFSTGYTPGLIHDFWDRTNTYVIESYLMRNGFDSGFTTPILAVNGFAGSAIHSLYSLLTLAQLPLEIPRIWSESGFVDSYSFDEGKGYTRDHYWVSAPLVGFSEGIFATLFNLLGELDKDKKSIWEIIMNIPEISSALVKMGITKSSIPSVSFDNLPLSLFTDVPQERILAKIRVIADIGSGKIYQDARVFEAIKYIVANLDKDMKEVIYPLSVNVSDMQTQVKYYALLIAAQRNMRDYFGAKGTFEFLRKAIDRAGALRDTLVDTASRIIYKYDLVDGEFSGKLTIDEIKKDLCESDASDSTIVSSPLVESELEKGSVIIDPKLPYDTGLLSFYIDKVYVQNEPLKDVISWILTYINITKGR